VEYISKEARGEIVELLVDFIKKKWSLLEFSLCRENDVIMTQLKPIRTFQNSSEENKGRDARGLVLS